LGSKPADGAAIAASIVSGERPSTGVRLFDSAIAVSVVAMSWERPSRRLCDVSDST
jgi:hypothetical protein